MGPSPKSNIFPFSRLVEYVDHIFFNKCKHFFYLNMQCRKTFLHFFDITECQHFGFYLLNETGKLLLIFSKFNNEHTANIDCSWASFLDILDDFSKFCSAFSTLLKNHQICLEFGKKWRKVFLHCTLLLVLREGPTYSANLSTRNHILCLIKIGPQNTGPTYWESPELLNTFPKILLVVAPVVLKS